MNVSTVTNPFCQTIGVLLVLLQNKSTTVVTPFPMKHRIIICLQIEFCEWRFWVYDIVSNTHSL